MDRAGRFYICRYNLEASFSNFSNDRSLIRLTKCQKRIPGQPPLPRRSWVGYDIEPLQSSSASVATSDTAVLPSGTSTPRKRDALFEDDPYQCEIHEAQTPSPTGARQ